MESMVQGPRYGFVDHGEIHDSHSLQWRICYVSLHVLYVRSAARGDSWDDQLVHFSVE